MRTSSPAVILPSIGVLLFVVLVTPIAGDAFVGAPRTAFSLATNSRRLEALDVHQLIRGGATIQSEDEDVDLDEFEDAEDEEFEDAVEEEEELKLAAATVQSTSKTKKKAAAKKKTTLKAKMNAKLASESKKSVPAAKVSKKKKSFLSVPYIVKATLNPFTLWAMTKAYWASLFQLEYLKKHKPTPDASQDLRSALEEKAKKGGGGKPNKGKRKMKRGQAKTLSDLPQLNT